MKIIKRDSLERTGFAGIKEHRIVTDTRLFGGRKKKEASEGLGQFVYLADANYEPKGQSGMHSHSEIDVISIVLEGRVAHEGSLEHGRDLKAGDVQVQRAGGEGFSHNEINPDTKANRMLQVWALPERKGEPASYKFYRPSEGVTKIYGGAHSQNATFPSSTQIEVVKLKKGERLLLEGETMSYVTAGQAVFTELEEEINVVDGDLIKSQNAEVMAKSALHMVVIKN